VLTTLAVSSVQGGVSCHRHGFTDPNMRRALTAHGAGAGGLGTGADRHKDGEHTWVECSSDVGGLCSVTALTASYVLMMKASWGGLTEEVRKVRLSLTFLPLISIIVSI
jgi:hypothetical protein